MLAESQSEPTCERARCASGAVRKDGVRWGGSVRVFHKPKLASDEQSREGHVPLPGSKADRLFADVVPLKIQSPHAVVLCKKRIQP